MPLAAVAVTAGVLASVGVALYYSVRVTTWAVMTDELQVARLATSIADSLSPVPTIHGVYYGAHSQLYPLLLAPFYGTLDAPAAATAAHALNAFLIASAAIPAFLLARSVANSSAAGYAAAALTACTPWLVLASTLLTENAAYPAFVWAVLLCQRTIAAPTAGRDVAALAGLLLAFLARTQLFVLALALPAALVLHEIGYADRRGSFLAALRSGVSRALSTHRVLTVAYGAGALVAVALAVTSALGSVVGNYAVPFEGELIPPGLLGSAAAHLAQIAVGAGILPAALAASWTVTTMVRPARREGHAFAALVVVLVPLLTFEVTSFDLRFTGEQFIQDRYLLYLVPLFAVGAAAWLTQRTHTGLRLATLAVAGGALAVLVGLATYDAAVIFWASPAAAVHPVLESASSAVGMSTARLVQAGTLALVLAAGCAAWRAPRLALIGTTVVVAGLGTLQAAYVFERFVEPAMTRAHGVETRAWIDDAAPARQVALVPGGADGPVPWWEAELWNENVRRVLRVDAGPTFTPFPADDLAVDRETGVLTGPQPTDFVVVSATEQRFRMLSLARLAAKPPLELLRVPRPYRVRWATHGVSADGWTRPDRLTTLRLYAHDRPGAWTIELTLAASRFSRAPIDFVLRGGGAVEYGKVDPGGARPPLWLTLCVPAGGYAETWLTSNGRALLPDGRSVALHVDRLSVRRTGPCRASQAIVW
jgi:hypothetical protein